MRRRLRRPHTSAYHVWDRDPNAPLSSGVLFKKCTCVRCGYALDAVVAQELFAHIEKRIPGRVADSDEMEKG